jgi:hypothetical protein
VLIGIEADEIKRDEKSKTRHHRRKVSKCLTLYTSFEGKGTGRFDGLISNNAGVQ